MGSAVAISRAIVDRQIARLSDALACVGADGCVHFQRANLVGFCGVPLAPSDRLVCCLMNRAGDLALVVPAFEAFAADAMPARSEIFPWDEHEDPFEAFHRAAVWLGIDTGRILVDGRMWIEVIDRLQQRLPRARLDIDRGVVERIRMIKSPDEVEAIRDACRHCSMVFDHLTPLVAEGIAENELYRHAATHLALADTVADIILVQSGPNAAEPHRPTGTRKIADGDAVIVDCVVRHRGYCGDMTRTYLVGEPAPTIRRAYDAVRRAHDAAIAMIRPGVTAGNVDATARNVIEQAGFGPLFLHRLGHGIGLDGHEWPYLVRGSDIILEPGMCFTVEPGIYFHGSFGIRIEDVVVVTGDGCEIISDLTPVDINCEIADFIL